MMKSIEPPSKKATSISQERIQYLYSLLDDSTFNSIINDCKDSNDIDKVVKDKQYATSIQKFLICQKQIPQFLIYDDLPEATDEGYIAITVELSESQLKQYLDMELL